MTDLRDAGDVSTGDLLDGRYRLQARIGEGATATVYRAEDTLLGRTVAVKILRDARRRSHLRRTRAVRDGAARLAQSPCARHAVRRTRLGGRGQLPRDGVRRGPDPPRPDRARAGRPGRGGLAHGRHRRGAARRPSRGHRPSGHQAVERAAVALAGAGARMAREDRGLRHRPPAGLDSRDDAGHHGRHRRRMSRPSRRAARRPRRPPTSTPSASCSSRRVTGTRPFADAEGIGTVMARLRGPPAVSGRTAG